ncbi:glycine zipper domain-containing protein [Pelagicoccus albus]|uniref:Glycine zipper domain-containing protein n=1 Tax=Pelagicoccus albus TaxID=415222 RepID=A0A7X1E8W6_9BACT|nr:glycine zipper domain-containing protein [Pelagicoccus albus]MBC2606558.1 hypothetical protein [Pelagicoccus albus]
MDNYNVSAIRLAGRLLLGSMLILFLQGCASNAYETVPRSTSGKIQQVDSGTVVATRTVVIEGEATYVGRSSGAIIGSAVGQTAGEGSGRTLAAAGGAVVGGIVGGMVEKEMTKKVAQEVTVSLDDGGTVVVVQERKDVGFVEGDRVSVTQTRTGEAHVSHAHYQSDGIY